MNSPITGKPMIVRQETTELSFRKETFEIVSHYYLDTDTSERFSSDELDALDQAQVYNRYREKYGIPFPDEIKRIREKYGVPASKMSEILGFGTNSYRLYESGEVPSVANGRLILAVADPREFRDQVLASTHFLTESELKSLLFKAEKLIKEEVDNIWDKLLTQHIFTYNKANEYSGYKMPDFQKIASLINFYADRIWKQKQKRLNKTTLNKLLFYSDFYHFKLTGYSITGITYRAIQLGPVPAEYDKLYNKLADDGLIEVVHELYDSGNYADLFISNTVPLEDTFDEKEKNVLEAIANKLLDYDTKKIVLLSHEEKAWIENQEAKNLISYPHYAFELREPM